MATVPAPGQATTYPDSGGIIDEEKGMQKARTLITHRPAPSRLPCGEVRPVLFEADD